MLRGKITMFKIVWVAALAFILTAAPVTHAAPGDLIEPDSDDPHKAPLGYWDIHVCNWPDRPPFYLTIFKTEHYDQLQSIEVFTPDGKSVGFFEMEKFLDFQRNGKQPLRVLLTHMLLPPEEPEGWFTAIITGKDGRRYLVKDYLVMNIMARAENQEPPHESEVEVPWELNWSPVPGAKHYRVWIRDLWDNGKQIYRSGLLNES